MPLSEEQLWQVTKAASLLDPNLRGNFLRALASRLEGVSRPTDRNVQVIVEIEARAATVERLFMISERQEWTFGETLEYALDALELALAKMATG